MAEKNEIIESEVIEKPLNNVIENFTKALKNISASDKVKLEITSDKQIVTATSNNGKTIEVFTRQTFGNTETTSHTVTRKTTTEERRETVKALESTKSQAEIANLLGVSQSTISKDIKKLKLKINYL